MTLSPFYHEILEFLNKNKLDLLVIREKISRKNSEISEELQLPVIDSHFEKTTNNLEKITLSCNNLINFWTIIHTFTGGLKTQEVMKKLLKPKNGLAKNLKSYGFTLLKSKQAKPIHGTGPLNSIDEESWLDLLNLLQSDTGFIASGRLMREIQNKHHEQRISNELQSKLKDHPDMSDSIKKEFTEAYHKSGLSVEEFLKSKYPDRKSPAKPRIKQTDITESKSNFDGYRTYMEADERELARMKRTGEYSVRKRGKKRKRSSST